MNILGTGTADGLPYWFCLLCLVFLPRWKRALVIALILVLLCKGLWDLNAYTKRISWVTGVHLYAWGAPCIFVEEKRSLEELFVWSCHFAGSSTRAAVSTACSTLPSSLSCMRLGYQLWSLKYLLSSWDWMSFVEVEGFLAVPDCPRESGNIRVSF